MEILTELSKVNFLSYAITTVLIFIGFKAFILAFEWVMNYFGIETKWMRERKEEHDLLIQTSQNLIALQKKHEEDSKRSDIKDEEICKDVIKLTNMFMEKEIDDLRWKILDFCSALSNGRKYNRETFDHIIQIYIKYEKILKENDMENGLVEESINFVREKYHEYLKNGNMEFSEEFFIEKNIINPNQK